MECCDQNDLGCVRLARRGAGRTLNEAWLLYRTELHRGSKLREAQISFDFALRRLRKVQFDGRVLAIANRIDGDPCKTCLRRLLDRAERIDRHKAIFSLLLIRNSAFYCWRSRNEKSV